MTLRQILLSSALLLPAWGCATSKSAQTAPQTSAMEAELRMLRESHARLEGRIRRLEAERIVSSAAPSSSSSRSGNADSGPELTVVKLKPRKDAAPRLQTAVPVTEPARDELDLVTSPVALSSEAYAEELPSADPAMTDLQYEDGLRALKTGNVEGGITKLLSFADENAAHANADNALYFAGLGRMGLTDFKGAAQVFEQLTTRYPAGDAVVDAMLKLAECRSRLNQRDDARALYTRIVLNYPGTAAATQAEQRLVALSR